MKPRLRSTLLLLLTLGLGIVLGALIQSNLHHGRLERLHLLRSEESFVTILEDTIGPLEPAAAATVRGHLEAYATRIVTRVRENRSYVRSEMASLETELAPLLNEAQRERLRERLAPRRKSQDQAAGQASSE